jgi:chromosome partitioning protein
MRSLAISNHKGGSGKTTTAVNLAGCLAERGRRVLLVDLDPQASASAWCGIHAPEHDISEVFLHGTGLAALVAKSSWLDVDVLPASTGLAGLEKALASEVGSETLLRRALAREAAADAWDYVLIDCPPALGLLTINALAAVHEVLVPVEAHVLALGGLAQLLRALDVVRERLNPELTPPRIVACRVDSRTRHAQEVVEDLRRRFGDQVHTTAIRENVRLAECPSFAQPIICYDSRSAGAADYRALADEILADEEKPVR